ncbi:aspartate ammonia-lyase [Ruegeria sp. Ofav3-42]|uniref:aspartate ammonia-lyase n=1 Tax=Ruegeria sp. Ofav3-42 TaxID=2917759 RepID=UPI001EF4BBE0|nr:aspartate ammonia-lyase [Ruegeria sp. Ofav3-42]MCG7519820.1 aspartate ammonia-lyase [Ruegeria sp. Ofav3-42]
MINRAEIDSLGSISLPADALYGIQTARAVENFPISDVPLNHFPRLVEALAFVKKAAARANLEAGVLDADKVRVIEDVCDEILDGQHHEHFIVDMIQGGAGTSTNMNANEVIANLGLQKLGHEPGDYMYLHPNDDVNRSQSTNDVYPTAIRLAVLRMIDPLIVAQQELVDAFRDRAQAFRDIQKVGRTQLQDAVPMTLGQEFASFANTVEEDIDRIRQISALLTEVNLGGTAIGTGANAPAGFAKLVVTHLSEVTGIPFTPAKDLIEASSDLGGLVMFSGVLKRVAVKISKICNDLRLLSSGPRAGFGEIRLPPVQAGSSIMPGKVNPVIPEVVNQVAYQVIGNDLTITMAAESGQLQLNAMEPIVTFRLLDSIRILRRSMNTLTERCVRGIEADEERCRDLLANSLVSATALAPILGYDAAARIAKQALKDKTTIQAAQERLGFAPKPT